LLFNNGKGFAMFDQDAHVWAIIAERHSEARDAARRAQLIAAHRASKQRIHARSRWIRRVLLAAR
jgi:hypothetical protein